MAEEVDHEVLPDRHESYGSGEGGSESSRSPLNNFKEFGLFKGSKEEKKVKVDGQPQKRRGPKPDAKPAMTRRQELNRQAQRTHRERKEMYIKALEQEVLRLKDTYGTVCKERDAFREESRKLRELLASHNINCPADLAEPLQPAPVSSSGSFSGSYAPGSDSTSPPPGGYNGPGSPATPQTNGTHQPMPNPKINVDQVGINFVLALERPCMDHMQMLCVKSQNSDEEVSGHALMATCPPADHIRDHPDVQYPHQVPTELPSGDLLKLLDLSARLPLEGEITPVMAWAAIMRNARFMDLCERDVMGIMNDLLAKVRCYGFGAVLEEFEVKDALDAVLGSKMDMTATTA